MIINMRRVFFNGFSYIMFSNIILFDKTNNFVQFYNVTDTNKFKYIHESLCNLFMHIIIGELCLFILFLNIFKYMILVLNLLSMKML